MANESGEDAGPGRATGRVRPLRGRFTVAFFLVLVGPILVGAFVLADVIASAGPPPAQARLSQGAAAARTAIAAECERLAVEAFSLAVVADGRPPSNRPQDAVPRPERWALCASEPGSRSDHDALAARREVRDGAGNPVGYAYAVAPIDSGLLTRLSVAAGVTVTVIPPRDDVETVALAPEAGQPLSLYLSVPPAHPAQTYPVVVATMLTATIAAGAFSRWLAGLVAGQYDGVVTELGHAEHRSVTDELTGLWNVRHLGESLRLEVERANRFGRALGVLALDLDRFKEVNDRFGHRAGDAVLAEFARRIRAVVREVDLVFRQGGEEFVVLLPETDLNGSATAARRVGVAIRQTQFTIPARRPDGPVSLRIPITVSIGVAVFPDHARTGTEVLDVADDALYAAKRAGRDTFVLATPRLPEQRANGEDDDTGSVDGGALDGTRPPLASRGG